MGDFNPEKGISGFSREQYDLWWSLRHLRDWTKSLLKHEHINREAAEELLADLQEKIESLTQHGQMPHQDYLEEARNTYQGILNELADVYRPELEALQTLKSVFLEYSDDKLGKDAIFKDNKYSEYHKFWQELDFYIGMTEIAQCDPEIIRDLTIKTQDKIHELEALPPKKEPKIKITPEILRIRKEYHESMKVIAPKIRGLIETIDLYQAHFPQLQKDEKLATMKWKLEFQQKLFPIMFEKALNNLKAELANTEKELNKHLQILNLHL